MDKSGVSVVYNFGSFSVDTMRRRLYRGDTPVTLNPKAFDALVLLIQNPGATVSRDAFTDTIWDDTTVEDNNLTQQISTLRKALGESRGEHRFIVTIPGKGYIFAVPVRQSFLDARAENGESRHWFIQSSRKIDSGRRTGFAIAFLYIFAFFVPFMYSGIRNTVAGKPQSLAVMQFRADRGDEIIGTGISDTLRARLGSVEDLVVRPMAPGNRDVLIAGRELKVDSIVTGSVQRADDRIRITVEMVNIDDGRVVWGKTFDDQATNIFVLQDAIVGEVATALRVRLTSGIRSLSRESFHLYAFLR